MTPSGLEPATSRLVAQIAPNDWMNWNSWLKIFLGRADDDHQNCQSYVARSIFEYKSQVFSLSANVLSPFSVSEQLSTLWDTVTKKISYIHFHLNVN